MLREIGGKAPASEGGRYRNFAAPVSCGLFYDSGDQRRARRDVRVHASSFGLTPGSGTSSLGSEDVEEVEEFKEVKEFEDATGGASRLMDGAGDCVSLRRKPEGHPPIRHAPTTGGDDLAEEASVF